MFFTIWLTILIILTLGCTCILNMTGKRIEELEAVLERVAKNEHKIYEQYLAAIKAREVHHQNDTQT